MLRYLELSVTVTVTKVFILRFLLKDQKRITVIYIYSLKARLNKKSFKTAFEGCCRRPVEFDVSR